MRLLMVLLATFLPTKILFAVEYKQIIPEKSTVGFAYSQMRVPMEGKFTKVSGIFTFDPTHPEKAQAKFDIALSSVNTGLVDADNELTGKLWFNSKTYPNASLSVNAVKALGNNRYQATGLLNIKGISKEVVVPFSFQENNAVGQITGNFAINRLDFKVGEGAWADTSLVANPVTIKFQLSVK